MTRQSSQAGYTLLEVVIAFGVLALALTLLLGILTHSSRQVRWAGDAGRAALLAQSVLDQVDVDGALRPGEREGSLDEGRYHWTLHVSRWRDPALRQALPTAGGPRLYRLDLSMRWGGGPRERLDLHSLRLQQPGIEAP